MKFSKLKLSGWRQFNAVDIDFHPRITIITGANGAGKSTILKILSQHFGWRNQLLATPIFAKEGGTKYFLGIFAKLFETSKEPATNVVGHLHYDNGNQAQLEVPENSAGVQYNMTIKKLIAVPGVNISSHRPIASYQMVQNIPTRPIRADSAYSIYFSETMSRYQHEHTQFGPIYRMKEALISMATFGPGNQYVQKDEAVDKLFSDFKAILSKILPTSIGFRDISVRIPDVVILTDTGDFVIDAVSGGLMSLIDLAWQIFLYSHNKHEFTVVFDEPENHLHPSMQRNLIRKLLEAFPNAQFVIATHSPFIVSSVRDSSVYVLKYDKVISQSESGINSRVSSIKLDNVNKAGSASEILRDALGVPATLPEWAEDDLRQIATQFKINSLSGNDLKELREKLEAAGLGEYYPEALKKIAAQQ